MQGPPLSPQEVAALVFDAVRQMERLGLDRSAAIRAVAEKKGVSPAHVMRALELYARGAAAKGGGADVAP